MKNVTLRIDDALYNEMSKNEGISFNEQINASLRKLAAIEKASMNELRGRFEGSEWKAIVDSLNGTYTQDETFRYSQDALIAHMEDSDLYEGIGAKWNIDVKLLCKKIKSLSSAQVDALYCRVEKFWEHPDIDLVAWALF
mgnify:FL=1